MNIYFTRFHLSDVKLNGKVDVLTMRTKYFGLISVQINFYGQVFSVTVVF